MAKVFHFYSDPAHGWLKVSLKDVAAVGLKSADFSTYSYARNNSLYLEEDCDASLFVKAFEAKFGAKPNYREHYANRSSKIRNYRPNMA